MKRLLHVTDAAGGKTHDPGVADAESSAPLRADAPFDRASRRAGVIVILVPILLVFVTYLFWYQTWFGRELSERDIGRYLSDTRKVRDTQHALSQAAARIARGDGAARQWYPQIVAVAGHREPQLRAMAAWTMGQDNHAEEFHAALRKLLDDPETMVRWNAALALVRFQDASGRPELRAMLRPLEIPAPESGEIVYRLKEGDVVRSGSIVARIEASSERRTDIVTPAGGRLENFRAEKGERVHAGQPLVRVAPGEEQVWESLRALYLVGTAEDLEDVERFTRSAPGLSERVRQQAELTAQAIRERSPIP
jgi:hypothetical protein